MRIIIWKVDRSNRNSVPRQGLSLGHAKVVLATRQVASSSTFAPWGGEVAYTCLRSRVVHLRTCPVVIVWAFRDRARVLIAACIRYVEGNFGKRRRQLTDVHREEFGDNSRSRVF